MVDLHYNFTPGVADVNVRVIKEPERDSVYKIKNFSSFDERREKRSRERDERIKRVVLLHKDGMSAVEIAKDLGITKQTVHKYLRHLKDSGKL